MTTISRQHTDNSIGWLATATLRNLSLGYHPLLVILRPHLGHITAEILPARQGRILAHKTVADLARHLCHHTAVTNRNVTEKRASRKVTRASRNETGANCISTGTSRNIAVALKTNAPSCEGPIPNSFGGAGG